MVIIANNVKVINNKQKVNQNEKPIDLQELDRLFENDIRDEMEQFRWRLRLIKSVCPILPMKHELKLGMMLVILGGCNISTDDSRQQSHMLIIGEPGTGKTQILQFCEKMNDRSVFVTGMCSTQAGLTVNFQKDSNNEWYYEAGALVLADQGLCLIDEFNLLSKKDYVSIHEALEQQTISVSKAGISVQLNARCTLIACCNPTTKDQKYQSELGLTENTGLQLPLLSRFDLIFVIVDQQDYDVDMFQAQFVISKFRQSNNQYQVQSDIPVELLFKIFKQLQSIQPSLDQDAQYILNNYYQYLRKTTKVTARNMEGLIRLSQAHAKMMAKQLVDSFDAISVIILKESAFNNHFIPNFETYLDPFADIDQFSQIYQAIHSIIYQ